MINYFQAAEKTLSNRAELQYALENLERRRSRIIRQSGPSGLPTFDFSKPYVSASQANSALADCLELVELAREIEATKGMIEEIDGTLEQLSADDADLLRAWYVEKKTKEEIAEALNYSSTTTVYDLKNKAVSRFALLFYGAGALASI